MPCSPAQRTSRRRPTFCTLQHCSSHARGQHWPRPSLAPQPQPLAKQLAARASAAAAANQTGVAQACHVLEIQVRGRVRLNKGEVRIVGMRMSWVQTCAGPACSAVRGLPLHPQQRWIGRLLLLPTSLCAFCVLPCCSMHTVVTRSTTLLYRHRPRCRPVCPGRPVLLPATQDEGLLPNSNPTPHPYPNPDTLTP